MTAFEDCKWKTKTHRRQGESSWPEQLSPAPSASFPWPSKEGETNMATTDQAKPVHVAAGAKKTLFLLEDLNDATSITGVAAADLNALRAVADWTRSFVVQPHRELGRPGHVCPFTSVALERRTLWLAAEPSTGRTVEELVHLVDGYKRELLAHGPVNGADADNKSILVVFPDLPAARAGEFFGSALERVGVSSYVEDGLVIGPFYQGNDGTAIYNPNFRPFTSPVPFLLMRRAVVSDWKFFLNKPEWFRLWAHRHGESGTNALADALRGLPWNARRD